jgi:hypothetical protein
MELIALIVAGAAEVFHTTRYLPRHRHIGHGLRDPPNDVQHYPLLACASAENTSWTKSPRYRDPAADRPARWWDLGELGPAGKGCTSRAPMPTASGTSSCSASPLATADRAYRKPGRRHERRGRAAKRGHTGGNARPAARFDPSGDLDDPGLQLLEALRNQRVVAGDDQLFLARELVDPVEPCEHFRQARDDLGRLAGLDVAEEV